MCCGICIIFLTPIQFDYFPQSFRFPKLLNNIFSLALVPEEQGSVQGALYLYQPSKTSLSLMVDTTLLSYKID